MKTVLLDGMSLGRIVEVPVVLRKFQHAEDAVEQDVEELHDIAVAGLLLTFERDYDLKGNGDANKLSTKQNYNR